MEFYENPVEARQLIEETIKRFGYAPEHHFDWWQFCADPKKGERNVFAAGGQGDGLLTVAEEGSTLVFSSPIAPPERRKAILIEYLESVLEQPDVKKVWLELETPLRKEFLKALPEKFKANLINYTLTWPVYNLKTFDPALPGGHFKYLRKEKHKFYRDHVISIADAKQFGDKQSLHDIVDVWRKRRGARDRAFYARYHNVIGGNFAGTAEARVFLVNGKPMGFNAGWRIPNRERFYGAVGIHNYEVPGLGLMLYLEDLEWLKARGYGEADMAGGEAALTAFKNEFLPESYYQTHVFSVVRK